MSSPIELWRSVGKEDFSVGSHVLNVLRDFIKVILKSKASRSSKPAMQLPLEYPPLPASLQESHPGLYAATYHNDNPIPSQISSSDWADMMAKVTSRCSSKCNEERVVVLNGKVASGIGLRGRCSMPPVWLLHPARSCTFAEHRYRFHAEIPGPDVLVPLLRFDQL